MNKSQQVQTITLAAAQQMAAAVEKKATEINVAVVFSVVDRGGNTLLIQRMDEAFVSSCDISLNKAWSACSLKQGTHEITPAVQPGQSLSAATNTGDWSAACNKSRQKCSKS